jgi:transposase-like protein
MISNARAGKLKLRAKGGVTGRRFEAWLIIQAVSWCLRYPLSDRDLESLFADPGFDVDHGAIHRRALA